MKKTSFSAEEASIIALNFIAFLVSNEERIERFSALTGLFLDDLKNGAQDSSFQGFVLEYALQDESLILEFLADQPLDPQTLQLARYALPGATYDM
ncbi:MAG: hypothetical protein RL761_389 [Pseudomonadota bacterium]